MKVIREYIRLTSPGITLLVILTGLMGMFLAARGTATPSPSLFLWTLLGLCLASAGSSVFNNCYDRDIDVLMNRTCGRPIPSGRINIGRAFLFGAILTLTASLILIIFVNILSAFLTILAVFTYAFVYTVLLKRRTTLATEIGGISGALPPVIGWTSVKGSIELFAIIYLWQPPHFWSLASRYRDDYKRAGIPTLPVKVSRDETNLRSLHYVFSLVMVSFLPYITGMCGKLYLYISLILGISYISLYIMTFILKRDLSRLLFSYSITYLSLIFISIFVDSMMTS